MKFSEAKTGRVYIIRLEDGEILHEKIESFAKEKNITAAFLQLVGGIDKNSKLIVGPEDGRAATIVPMELSVDDVREVTGTGTLFPDDNGQPVLHVHIACGRNNHTITGCVRNGVIVWHVLEVVLIELLNCTARRMPDKETGFKLLQP